MRFPLRSKSRTPRARVVSSRTTPAPVGGWNARDSLAEMRPDEAVTLKNWFPGTSYCEIRGGTSEHVTGMGGTGKTLAVYNALNGTNKMFCSTNTTMYDATSAVTVSGNYLSLAGSAGDYASTPDSAALDIVGDIDLRARVAAVDFSSGASQAVVTKWNTTGDQRSYWLGINGSGGVEFAWSAFGTLISTVVVTFTPSVAFVDGVASWFRVTLDVDDGSGNFVVRLYLSADGVTWTLDNTFSPPTTTSIYSSTATLNIGADSAGTASNFSGKIFNTQVYNSAGTLAASFAGSDAVSGATSVVSSATSEVYTCNGTAVIAGSVVVGSGITSGKWQTTMFGDGTSNWLIMVNGADKPLYFDGSTWTAVDNASSPALTGLTTTNIISVNVFKGRLFFIAKQSLSFWYLNAGVAGGALTEFDLSAECKRGGYLMAMASWTIDGGNGSDDRAVFITSEGEVIVYQGNNPSNAAAWSKVGSYYLGTPLGRRCWVQYGGDLVILTQNGAYPLSAGLQSASIDYKAALSFLIENAFTSAARSYGSTFGWEALIYPARSAMIVNIPVTEGGEHKQYVMNTITRKWCEFDSWNAEDFAVFNGELYFVAGTAVYKAWTGTNDNGSNIVAYGKQAFSNLGTAMPKKIVMYRPVLAADGSLSFLTDIDADFVEHDLMGTADYDVSGSGVWDTAIWDQSNWASGLQITKEWTSPDEWAGVWISAKIKITTRSLTVQWIASDYIFQPTDNPMG